MTSNMKSTSRERFLISILLALTIVMGTIPGLAPASAMASTTDSVTVGEVSAALDQSKEQMAAPAESIADGDSAAKTDTVNVPRDPNQGIEIKGPNGQTITVNLPYADRAGRGTKTSKGAVAFEGQDGSANVVIPAADGVQFLTVIESRKAPTQYTYRFDLPAGSRIEVAAKGSTAVVFDEHNKAIAVIPAPFAQDSNGKTVETYFTTDGRTLTQHVAHRSNGVAHPVVSDPYFRWYWNGVVVTLSRAEMAAVAAAGIPTLYALIGVPVVGWATLASVAWVSTYAAWAYANHYCAWFWLPYWGYGGSAGWYRC